MKRNLLVAIGVLAAALTLWMLFFRGSEEDLVRRVLVRTAKAIEVVPGENPVMRAARVRSELIEVLAPDVAITIPELTDVSKGRDPWIGLSISASQLWERAEASIAVARVTVEPTGADVEATATISGARPGGQAQRDVRRCRIHLAKRDGAYRITEVSVYPPSD